MAKNKLENENDILLTETLLQKENMILAAISLLPDKIRHRATKELITECQNFHLSRKHKLTMLLNDISTSTNEHENVHAPEELTRLLLSDSTTEKSILGFLCELEQKLLPSYKDGQVAYTSNHGKKLASEFLAEQTSLCKKLNILMQSLTHSIDLEK